MQTPLRQLPAVITGSRHRGHFCAPLVRRIGTKLVFAVKTGRWHQLAEIRTST